MRRYLPTIAGCIAMPLVAAAQTIPPPPSPALVGMLALARTVDLGQLAAWAPHAAPPPALTGGVALAEAKILALPAPDRDALLYWLAAHGRGALHARGTSDIQIGVPYYPIDYKLVPAPFPTSILPLPEPAATAAPTPAPRRRTHFGMLGALLPALQIPIASTSSSSTSTTTSQSGNATEIDQSTQSSGASVSIGGNPWEAVGSLIDASVDRSAHPAAPPVAWQNLPFAASALSAPGSLVTVIRGFAAVRADGTEGVACISFVNHNTQAATQVDVDIEILDGFGLIRRVQALRRSGTFSPGVEIGGPSGPLTVSAARSNCVIDGENTLADATDPFSGAGGVVYAVRQVRFADGSAWLQPGANAWAP